MIKKIHFIGICGIVMSGIAIELRKKGVIVTGSDDDGVYDPVKSILAKNDIEILKYDKCNISNKIDLIIVGKHTPLDNIEYIEAKKKNIKIKSFPEFLCDYLKNKKNIVICGNQGKTTISSLLVFIYKKLRKDPSYLVGGYFDKDRISVQFNEDNISILEGDEYVSSNFDLTPKFHYYNPFIVLITNIQHDHLNFFPEEKDYLETYLEFIKKIPANGLLIIDSDNIDFDLIKKYVKCRIVKYGLSEEKEFTLRNIIQNNESTEFNVYFKNKKIINISTKLFGQHNLKNILAAFIICYQNKLGIVEIKQAIEEFESVTRRLELVYEDKKIKIFDDIAHHPSHVRAVISALKEKYPDRKLSVIYELYSFPLAYKEIADMHKDVFTGVDKLLLFNLDKKDKIEEEERVNLNYYKKIIDLDKEDILIYKNNKEILEYLINAKDDFDIVLFMSLGNYKGILDRFIQYLK